MGMAVIVEDGKERKSMKVTTRKTVFPAIDSAVEYFCRGEEHWKHTLRSGFGFGSPTITVHHGAHMGGGPLPNAYRKAEKLALDVLLVRNNPIRFNPAIHFSIWNLEAH